MADKTLRLGIDIGGTKAHLGLVYENGTILSEMRLPMEKGLAAEDTLTQIIASAEQLLTQQGLSFVELAAIGVGIPGTVDAETGFLLKAPNLGWENISCGDLLQKLTGRRVFLMQDSRAAALGEYLFGSAKGADVLVSITLGTGIGCGIMINGKVYAGGLGASGESGHINVVPGGRLCGCGQRGCLEAYASGTGITASAGETPALKGRTSEEIFALANQNNEAACELIAGAVTHLGNAMNAIINILSPNAMIFSGGMCTQETLFLQPLFAYIRSHAYSVSAGKIQLDVSTLGSIAPLIGAAMLDKAQGEDDA